MTDTAVVVVGAGPVGLMAAHVLGRNGVEAVVLERREPPGRTEWSRPAATVDLRSRAIGIMPPSVDLFDGVGLADEFLCAGVRAATGVVHDERSELGRIDFQGVHPRFPFVLAIPQWRTESILASTITRRPTLQVRYGVTVEKMMQEADGITLCCRDGSCCRARYAIVCDGAHGSLAANAGIRRREKTYRARFFMADHHDLTNLGDEAHLWFTPGGAVESFPLPGSLRRWIVQLPSGSPLPGPEDHVDLECIVETRTGYTLDPGGRTWQSSFAPQRSELSRFHQGRLLFAGDASHTMSPIGGQGMNTGFADAELAATLVAGRLDRRFNGGDAWGYYERARKRAGRSAARRAWAGMHVGTITGRPGSWVRSRVVSVALRTAAPLLARHFAMMSIPNRRASGRLPRRLTHHGDPHKAAE